MESYYFIDTDIMTNITVESINASSSVKDSADLLDKVIQHDDWCCKEKDAINENIRSIKTNALLICDAFEAFSTAVRNTAQRYVDMVNEEQKDILDINQAIGNLYASELNLITPSITSGVSTSSYIDSNCTLSGSAMDCNTVYNMNSPIQLVGFKDIAQAVEIER